MCSVRPGFAVLAVVTVSLAGCSSASTPEAAYANLKDAADKKDIKRVMGCMTTESQDQMAGTLAFAGMMRKGMSEMPGMPADTKASVKKVAEVMAKHGLTDEYLKSLDGKKKAAFNPADFGGALKDITAPVKDKPAFVADMFAAMPQKDGAPAAFDIQYKGLKDVKITGDKATGTAVQVMKGKESETPMNFVKQNGSWKIDLAAGFAGTK